MRYMRSAREMESLDGGSGVVDLQHGCGDSADNSGACGPGGEDDVLTGAAPRRARGTGSGGQPAALRRGTEKNKVRGYETRRRLIELHVTQGKCLVECAQVLGLSYGRVLAQWHRVVAEACGDGPEAGEMRRDVRTFLDQGYRHMWEKSVPLIGESAAHGSVALKALEGLGRLYGVVGPEVAGEASGAATLAEVGASVRVVSPLLVGKMERIKAMQCRADG